MTFAATLTRDRDTGSVSALSVGLRCLECERNWEHCHDAIVIHANGEFECSAPGSCRLTVEFHAIVIECADLSPACCCGK